MTVPNLSITPAPNGPVAEFDPMNPASVTPPPALGAPVITPPAAPVITPPAAAPVIAPTNPNEPVQTGDDAQWLQTLINNPPTHTPATHLTPGVAPVITPPPASIIPPTPVAAAVAPVAPAALPDFAQPNVEFLPSTVAGQLPKPENTNGEVEQPKSEMEELRSMLADMKGDKEKTAAEAEFQTQVDSALEGLKSKFGTADPKLIEEFNDIFTTFRAQLGQELMTDTVRDNLELKQQIQQLRTQIENVSKTVVAPEPQVSDTNVYRNTVAQAVPNYQNLVSSGYFKQLLETPVDPHNPDYTYNHKLGNMYRSQQTQDIISFFSEVSAKIAPANVQNTNVVVDGGTPAVTPVSQDSLTTDKLQDVLTKVMNGELKVTEEDMFKLRQMHAKLAMKSN